MLNFWQNRPHVMLNFWGRNIYPYIKAPHIMLNFWQIRPKICLTFVAEIYTPKNAYAYKKEKHVRPHTPS